MRKRITPTDKHRGHATAEAAREAARTEWTNDKIVILHSPHDSNSSNSEGTRLDYYIDAGDTLIRNWETTIYQGKGAKA